MKRRKQLEAYGRMAVGQRVRYDRCIMPPTLLNSFWNNRDEPVSIHQLASITAIAKGEDHAFVTLRFEEGGEKTELFNSWGQEPGGFRWALREIHPLHPDVPYIVYRINTLTFERKSSC